MAGLVSGLVQGAKAVPLRLVAAYFIDWVVLVILGLISYGFSKTTPHYHAFSVLDLSISYPKVEGTISIAELAGSTILAPAAIIAIAIFLLVPGPAAWKRMSRGEILRVKLWEFNVAWLGMAMAQATQFCVVQGMKNVIGKPRPHMLAVCQPDLDNLSRYVVGGYGRDLSSRWVLVNHNICQQQNMAALKNAFQSFPSGHASTAWAGMLYLSLWLALKLGVALPVIPFHRRNLPEHYPEAKAPISVGSDQEATHGDQRVVAYRDEAAGGPIWGLFIIYIPLGVAFYTTGTRYFNYYHHGFDVIAGSLFGIVAAWIGFRWYHPSLSRSAGWAWSPRSRDRAFGIGVGSLGYVTDPAELSKSNNNNGHPAAAGAMEEGNTEPLSVPYRN